MASGYTVSGLTDYVKTNQDVLIKGVVLGSVKGDTIPRLRKQFGVKTKELLNILDVDPVLQSGAACGWSASGSTEFSEREIETAQIKAQDEYCEKTLLGKVVEFATTAKADDNRPFEAEILDEVVGKINEKMEKLVWQGATSANSGTDLIDGFLTQALNQDSASTIMVTGSSATSISARVEAVIMALPEEILDKATIFLAPSAFRALAFELQKNYKYNANLYDANVEDKDILYPGSEVRIHKTLGLIGSDKIYASVYTNMVYGCDLENDFEKVRAFEDQKNGTWCYDIQWNAGVKTIFPDMVVVGDFSA